MRIVFKQNNYLLLVKETVKFLSPKNVNRKNIELCRTDIILQKRKKNRKNSTKNYKKQVAVMTMRNYHARDSFFFLTCQTRTCLQSCSKLKVKVARSFVQYFKKYKEDIIKYHAMKGAVRAYELREDNDKFYNNSVEAINKLIKNWQNFKKTD